MSIAVYVIDTSYLVELFGCGRFSNSAASEKVRERFKAANKAGGRFFVPLPCLFELGDHIADVGHNSLRQQLADHFVSTVQTSLNTNKPWTITPTGPPQDILPSLLARFAPLAAEKGIGLVDTFTLNEALRLQKTLKKFKARIHIWTNDRQLKAMNPTPSWSSTFGNVRGQTVFLAVCPSIQVPILTIDTVSASSFFMHQVGDQAKASACAAAATARRDGGLAKG